MNETMEQALREIDEKRRSAEPDDVVSFITEKANEFRQVCGPLSTEYACMLNELGGYERDHGMYRQSTNAFLEAVQVQTDAAEAARLEREGQSTVPHCCGWKDPNEHALPADPELATTLCNLGGTYRLMRDFEAAEVAFDSSMAIYEATLGTDNPVYAAALNNLALLRQDQERYPEALELHERVGKIIGDAAPADYHATHLFNEAMCRYMMKTDLDRAAGEMREALDCYKKLGEAFSTQAERAREVLGWIEELGGDEH